MADNLRLLADWFWDEDWPAMPCPECKIGNLRRRKDSIVSVRSAESLSSDDADPDWEPEWWFGHFHGTLYCEVPSCNGRVVVSGEYHVEQRSMVGPGESQYGDRLKLLTTLPPLPIVVPPDGTPIKVREKIDIAATLIWVDPPAASNALRAAIECLLSARGVPKTTIGKQGRTRLSLHDRIKKFKAKNPLAAISLEAVKWVGNQGSHDGEGVQTEHVIEAAAILGQALRDIYDQRDAELRRRAIAINKAKRIPRSRKERS